MSDNSTDPYDVRNELRMELIVLNADLTELNKKWDFSTILRPLLEETDTMSPLMTQIERLNKQKYRMTKLKDGFLRQEQERKEQEQSRPAPPPAAAAPKRRRKSSKRRGDSTYSIQDRTSETPCIPQNAEETPISMPTPCIRRIPPIPENPVIPVTPAPIEPSWGPLKRYTEQCTEKTYHQAVAAAKWLYDHMRSTEGGPASLSTRALDRVPNAQGPSPRRNFIA